MSPPTRRLRHHLPLLKNIINLPDRQQKNFIKTAHRSVLDSICECCINILNGCIRLNGRQKTRLSRNKQDLRRLVLKKTAVGKKRKLLQKGGFLSAILSAAIPVVGSLIASAVTSVTAARRRRRAAATA